MSHKGERCTIQPYGLPNIPSDLQVKAQWLAWDLIIENCILLFEIRLVSCSSQMNFIKAFVLEWNISFKMLYTSVNNMFF